MLDHLEGRLDKMTAVIRQVVVQGRALEPVMLGEDTSHPGLRDSLEELEAPALQSSLEEHKIVDGQRKTRSPMAPSLAAGGRREGRNRRWRIKGDGPWKSMTRPKA